MRVRLRYLVCAAAALAGFSSSIPAAQNAPPNLRDGSHDMDFGLGNWRTEIASFSDPFGHPKDAQHMTGTKTARSLWNGKALIEEIEADGPSGHWEAANLFLYDPNARQWSQNYVDSASGRFEGEPGIGEMRGGKFEFTWQTKIDGRAILERGVWSDFTPTSHTYTVERSNDGGRSWHMSFIAHLTKIQ